MVRRDRRCLGIAFAMSFCLIGPCLTSFWIGLATNCLVRTPLAFSGPYHCTSCWPFRLCGLYLSHMPWRTRLWQRMLLFHPWLWWLCVEGHVQVALAWMSLHLCLPESDRVTLIGLVAICSCCHMRLTGRSQEANWADFAQASSGASGTAIEDKRTVWVSELRACNTWALRRQPAAVLLK